MPIPQASIVTGTNDFSILPENFRKVMARYPTGIVAVTSTVDGAPVAMIVGSFVSVSLSPPLVAFIAGRGSASYQKLKNADRFVINVLGAEQTDICRVLSSKSVADRWADVEWTPSAFGHPVITNCVAHVECTSFAVHAAGDHDIVIGAVESMTSHENRRPLIFFEGGFHQVGTPSSPA